MTNLNINGATWMVDDCPHVWTIQKHAKDFHGKVLIAGLGLGLIVHALSKNEKVTEIIVVEREKDVIELIKPLIPNCTIINDDWYNYPVKQADGVFYDLFVGEGESLYMDAIEEMIGLRRKFPNATCRILGFHNDNLQNIADLMLSASKVLLAKQHMRYQNG
jgi:threonine dehydrogenase-like Zn-dependent dehydrogenase